MLPILRFRSLQPVPVTALDQALGQTLHRAMTIGTINEEARTVELSFSSDAEIERWGDIEVLSHKRGAVDLTRLNNGASLLFNHNFDDPIGVVESAEISNGKGRAVVRFGRSEDAEERWQDVKDGILRNVSVGYRVVEQELTERRADGRRVYTVNKWLPYEISIVTVPVDPSVGVGRSITSPQSQNRNLMNREQMIAALRARGYIVADEISDAELNGLFTRSLSPATPPAPTTPAPAQNAQRSNVQVTTEHQPTADDERSRVRSIMASGKKLKMEDIAERAITEGKTVDEFRQIALDEFDKRSQSMKDSHTGLGLSDKDAGEFRVTRLIRSLVDPQNKALREEAAHEHAVCEAAAEKAHRNVRGVLIPSDVLRRPLDARLRGDTVSIKSGSGYTGDGGNTVQTTLLASSFIDLLRNRATIMRRATVLTGLVGNFDMPKQTAGSNGYWIGEDEDAPKEDVAFGLIGLRPHTVANLAEITRRMLMQPSLDVEALVRRDLAEGIAQAIDFAGYYGDGTGNAPIGIKESNPQVVDFSSVNPTFAELVEMETAISESNLDPASSVYVARSAFRGYAKTTLKFSGVAGTIWEPGNTVNGYGTEITNQITAGDVFFGDFADLIMGMWGGLEITVDPYTHSSKGRIRIVCMQDVDFEVRRAESFVYGARPSGS
jgi:HK97 family phage major capsid protein/HK97 family phage prohead protease